MMRQGRSPHDYFTPSERDLPVLVLLVKEGLVTAIENIKLEDVELTLEQTEVLMSVARRVVVLENVKLPPTETEDVFRSLARLSWGLLLMDGVDIDTAAATAGLAKISGDLSRISPGLGKGSKLRNRNEKCGNFHNRINRIVKIFFLL